MLHSLSNISKDDELKTQKVTLATALDRNNIFSIGENTVVTIKELIFEDKSLRI